jgi:hypothetical protein
MLDDSRFGIFLPLGASQWNLAAGNARGSDGSSRIAVAIISFSNDIDYHSYDRLEGLIQGRPDERLGARATVEGNSGEFPLSLCERDRFSCAALLASLECQTV